MIYLKYLCNKRSINRIKYSLTNKSAINILFSFPHTNALIK